MLHPKVRAWQAGWAIAAVVVLGCAPRPGTIGGGAAPGSRPGDTLHWHGSGVWLRGETHTHRALDTSAGRVLVETARRLGADFLISTEHAQDIRFDRAPGRTAALRAREPELILLAGLEWNVPGGDHATVVVEQSPEEWSFLEHFVERFDRRDSEALDALEKAADIDDDQEDEGNSETWGEIGTALKALRYLDAKAKSGAMLSAVYLNHPGRHDYFDAEQIGTLVEAGLAGVEAAPGHQRKDPPAREDTLDRHEPFVALAGGGYDSLLARGLRVGLSAGSDFHKKKTAYMPGEFSETLVHAPERSSRGVVQGLRAGATVTVLGGIVTLAEPRLSESEDGTFAGVAETLVARAGIPLVYSLRLEIPPRNSIGLQNRIDLVEIVSNCLGPTSVVETQGPFEPGTVTLTYALPGTLTASPGTCFLRARGRQRIGGLGHDARNADLMFHTAPTFLRVAP